MISQSKRIGGLMVAAMIAAAACSSGGSPSPSSPAAPSPSAATSAEPSESAAALTGEISISGSSTVQPISEGVRELFNETYPDVAIAVDGPGTGDGFQLFCAGETDISDASRAIKQEEADACTAAGVEYVELKVAIDGLSILTSTSNTNATCLSFADLYALTGPESEGFETWAAGQALATELGSKTQLPDAPLVISGPGEESGTYDYYVEAVITPIAEGRSKDSVTRKDYQSSPNDNVIIEGIAGSNTSLGWVGYAFAVENADTVRPLEVSAPDGACTAPTPDTIASGDYPLARDLFIYVNKAKAAENPALAAFVDFYLADGTIASVNQEVGYIDLAPEVLAESRTAWEGR